MADKPQHLFDTRLQRRHLDRGLITTDEVDALLASLPDEAEECEPCETVFEHTTQPAGEPMIEEALPLD